MARTWALGPTLLATMALAFFAFAATGRPLRPALAPLPRLLSHVEWLLVAAGGGLEQIDVTGHRFTPDSDILDAVDVGNARTLLSFDSRAAQARLEQLPWIEHADIERIFPDRLMVRVRERMPRAVWRLATRHFLIDSSGRVLAAVAADAMPALPCVAGEGAAREAAGLLAQLAAYPELLAQLDCAERVGGRRWTLRLARTRAIQLPAADIADALPLAAAAVGGALAEGEEIDLRVAGRMLLRQSPQAPSFPAAAGPTIGALTDAAIAPAAGTAVSPVPGSLAPAAHSLADPMVDPLINPLAAAGLLRGHH